jgi:acetyl-CoA acetyltransferase
LKKYRDCDQSLLKEGTVTAANASTINDGAAALVLADEAYCPKIMESNRWHA